MDQAKMDLASLVNHLMLEDGVRRVAMMSTITTGTSTLLRLDLGLPSVFTSLQFADEDFPGPGRQTPAMSLDDVRRYSTDHGLAGSFDLLVVDPHHTYPSSVECLEAGLALIRPGGLLLVHDCLPPFDLTAPAFTEGAWCGVTFAAFREVCSTRLLDWCTIDANYGIGVAALAGPPSTPAVPPEARAWPDSAAIARMIDRYQEDPFAMMRAVAPEQALEAIARVREGRPMDDLIIAFKGLGPQQHVAIGGQRAERAEVLALAEEVQRVTAELAAATSALVELRTRPSQQIRALRRSLPAAIRIRASRLRNHAERSA